MSYKYLIFGATGSIGSSLAQQLKESNQDAHLISRNEEELKSISEKLGFSFTVFVPVVEEESWLTSHVSPARQTEPNGARRSAI